MSNPKKIGLMGVFEDYQANAIGPSFYTIPGANYGRIKEFLHHYSGWPTNLWFIHDASGVLPAAACFGSKELDTALCYLYTSLSHTIECMSNGHNVLVFQSVVDMYAEIMMHNRRQKWLEPLIQREIASYDKLILIPNSNPHHHYDSLIRRIMHDFKGNYVKANDLEQIIEEVELCL